MVRRCPVCGEGHGADVGFCPKDGAALHEEDDDLRPGDVLGAYRLVRLLGEGGMGQVYQAEHQRIGRKVAIKVLWPSMAENRTIVRRFCAEAEAVNRFRHPHIVEIVDFVDEPIPFCVMELLVGQDLESLMEERVLAVSRVIDIAIQMADALHAAHGAGIVHRDLKPSNVFLVNEHDRRDFVKLLDFGIAKSTVDSPSSKRVQTTAGMVLGTPEYMSPEQASGRTIDHRTDIYSFGVMLYEMICGEPPFSGGSVGELVVKHITQKPAPPSQLPKIEGRVTPDLESLILACLAKSPDERPTDMGVLRDRLKSLPAFAGEDILRSGAALDVSSARTAALPSGDDTPTPARKVSRETPTAARPESFERLKRASVETAARESEKSSRASADRETGIDAPSRSASESGQPASADAKADRGEPAPSAVVESEGASWPAARIAGVAAVAGICVIVLLVFFSRPTDGPVDEVPGAALAGEKDQPTPTEPEETFASEDAGMNGNGVAAGDEADEHDTITLDLTSTPEGAAVYKGRDEEPIGSTPLTVSLPLDTKTERFVFRHSGYEDFQEEVPLDASARIRVALRPEPSTPDRSRPASSRRATSSSRSPRAADATTKETGDSRPLPVAETKARPEPRPAKQEREETPARRGDEVIDPFSDIEASSDDEGADPPAKRHDRDEVFDPFSN